MQKMTGGKGNKMSTLTLKGGIRTRRNHWQCDVELYKTREDAMQDGYSLMYEDEEGSIYGIRDPERMHSWKKVAFFPYPQYYSKYESRAIG